MEEFVVYVLTSVPSPEKIYIGYTSDLINRMKSHNHFSSKGHTTRFRPWRVAYVEFHDSKPSAMKREIFLKSGVGRVFVHEMLGTIQERDSPGG